MTVKELVTKLKTLPQDVEVNCTVPDSGGYDCTVGTPSLVVYYPKVNRVWVGEAGMSEKDLKDTLEYDV